MQGSGGRARAFIRDVREFGARLGEEFPVERQPKHNWRCGVGTYWILGSAMFAAWFWGLMDEVACKAGKLEARKVVGVSQALLLIGPCRGLLWGNNWPALCTFVPRKRTAAIT